MNVFIDLLKVILAWPTITLVVCLIFVFKFSDSIRFFLEKHTLKKAGPLEFESQQKENDFNVEIEKELENRGVTFTEEEIQHLKNEFDNLSKTVDVKENEIKKSENVIQYLFYRAEFFEFNYLNIFFVLNTKNALLWFNNVNQATKELFDLTFQQIIPSPLERETIVNVLLNYEMIEVLVVNILRITDKGKRLLQHIGYIKNVA